MQKEDFLYLGLTFLSTHFRTVPACNRGCDTHFIALFHRYITPLAHPYAMPPGHITLAMSQPIFTFPVIKLDKFRYLRQLLELTNKQFIIICKNKIINKYGNIYLPYGRMIYQCLTCKVEASATFLYCSSFLIFSFNFDSSVW